MWSHVPVAIFNATASNRKRGATWPVGIHYGSGLTHRQDFSIDPELPCTLRCARTRQKEQMTMQSAAPAVDAYLAEVPADRRNVLSAIRQLCRDNLPGYEESMQYGMPSYAKDGVVEVAFASQKNYISFYGLKQDAFEPMRDQFTGAQICKGCIRYSKPEKIPLDAVARLLQATAASNGKIC
jgi:uncharacterized protein YdhG (YjbR/CyaY superfamily)